MNTVSEILNAGSIEGNVFKLPPTQLDRKLYQDVAKALQGIGGAWKGGKVMGFVFSNPMWQEDLARLLDGESLNLKKDFQFFETPASVLDILRGLVYDKIAKHHDRKIHILEPSAGSGAILKMLINEMSYHPTVKAQYTAVEINPRMLPLLQDIPNVEVHCPADFLEWRDDTYDLIVANPPFTKNQDIQHIRRMFSMLKPDGLVVSVTSPHWQFANDTASIEHREWANNLKETHRLHYTTLSKGAFKESGTLVESLIVSIGY